MNIKDISQMHYDYKSRCQRSIFIKSINLRLLLFSFLLAPFSSASNAEIIGYEPPAEGWMDGYGGLVSDPKPLGDEACGSGSGGLDHLDYEPGGMSAGIWCKHPISGYPPYFLHKGALHWRSYCDSGNWSQTLADGTRACPVYATDSRKEAAAGPPCQAGGTNPINITNGNKYQRVSDYRVSHISSLRFERFYNSNQSMSVDNFIGQGWRHYYQKSLYGHLNATTTVNPVSRYIYIYGFYYPRPIASDPSNPNFLPEIYINREDGSSINFELKNSVWQAHADIDASLIELPANAGWQFTDADDNKEFYSSEGKLIRLENTQGLFQTLAYDTDGRLSQVQHQFGQTLSFVYDSDSRISVVTTDDNQQYQYSYDSAGRLVTVTYPGNDTETYHYENTVRTNHLTGISKNGQRYATWTYDYPGGAISSEHAGGADKITLSGSAGSVTATNALGAEFVYTSQLINGVYKPTQSSFNAPLCGNGNKTSGYDTNGWLNQSTDFEGNKTTYVREAARGLELSRTEAATTPQARTITTEWHEEFRLPTKVTEPGQETVNTYDVKGNRLSQTIKDLASLETRTTSWTYNTYGQVLTIDGPRTDVNDVTTYTYYDCNTGFQCGQIATVSNALGQVTTYNSYDAQGRVLAITDANGVATTLTYTPRGWLNTVTRNGASTDYDYNAAGQVIKITSTTGSIMHFDYDAAERLVGMRDGLGNRIEYVLNALGNRTADNTYDPSNVLKKTSAAAFDEIGRLIQTIGANSQTTAFVYDKNGQQTQLTDANTQATNYAYDALSRLTEQTDAALSKTGFVYDARDNLIEVTDARGLVTSYNYNGFDEVITQVSADTGVTSYQYDSAGNLIQKTDAKNIVTDYQYDGLNRIISMSYPSDITLNVTYRYDGSAANGVGRLAGIDDALGSINYAYDPHGNLIEQTHAITTDPWTGTGSYSATIAYSYDLDNRLQSITYPSGRVVSYTRDLAAQINQVSATLGLNSQTILDQIQYQPFAGITDAVFGNGLNLKQSFDQDARITAISHAQTSLKIQDLAYQYDLNNNITQVLNNLDATRSQNYGYDQVNRLSNYDVLTGKGFYQYDCVGNRLMSGIGDGTLPEPPPLLNGIIAAYNFNGGQFSDVSGNGHDGTVDGVVNTVTGRYGDAASVESTTGSVQFSAVTEWQGLTQYTLSAWIKLPVTISSWQLLLGKASYWAAGDAAFHCNGTTCGFYNGAGSGRAETDISSYLGGWHLWTASYDNGAIFFYIDGVQKAMANFVDTPGALPLIFGKSNANAYHSVASVDDLMLHNRVLSSAEIQQIAQATESILPTAPSTGPTGCAISTPLPVADPQDTLYQYASSSQQLQSLSGASNKSYSYDANGNPTSIANNSYIYNAQNRLSEVKNAANQNIASYSYNALGQRMLKTTGSSTTLYLYDQSGSLLSEVHADGSARDYIYINGQRLAIAENNNYYYIHSNHLDTPQSITDQNQTIVWAADYDPFGEATVTVSTIENNLRFPGQYFDQETGTHYNYFRDYDAAIGRYLQSDPIGLILLDVDEQQFKVNLLYDYALNNPIINIDILGLNPQRCNNKKDGKDDCRKKAPKRGKVRMLYLLWCLLTQYDDTEGGARPKPNPVLPRPDKPVPTEPVKPPPPKPKKGI